MPLIMADGVLRFVSHGSLLIAKRMERGQVTAHFLIIQREGVGCACGEIGTRRDFRNGRAFMYT